MILSSLVNLLEIKSQSSLQRLYCIVIYTLASLESSKTARILPMAGSLL